MTQVAGVDGCPKGWISVVLADGRFARAEFSPTFAELLTHLAEAQVIAVDIPIGLPDGFESRPIDTTKNTPLTMPSHLISMLTI